MDLKVGYLVDYRDKATGGGGLATVTDMYENLTDGSALLRLQPIDERLAGVFFRFKDVEFIKVYKEVC